MHDAHDAEGEEDEEPTAALPSQASTHVACTARATPMIAWHKFVSFGPTYYLCMSHTSVPRKHKSKPREHGRHAAPRLE